MKTILGSTLLLSAAAAFAAAPKPANVFGSNMVLQRDAAAPIWGTAEPGSEVQLDILAEDGAAAIDGATTLSAKADENGRWEVRTPAIPAGGPYTLAFSAADGASATITNVLFGDVWICSGQSNMEMSYNWGLVRGKEDMETNVYPTVRTFIVPNANSGVSHTDIGASQWLDARLDHVRQFSACGYFFGEALHKALPDIPIGLIDCTWSGTIIETWLSYDSIEALGGSLGEKAAERKAMAKHWLNGGRESFKDDLAEWSRQRLSVGSTNGIAPYAVDFPDAELPEHPLPNDFGALHLKKDVASVWFRRTVSLTAEQAAATNAVLSLGPVDDEEFSFVNGKKVGHTSGWNTYRKYPLEPGLLKEGENQISILIINWGGRGGMLPDKADQLALGFGDESVSLTGPWKWMNVQDQLPPAPESFDAFPSPNVHSACYNARLQPLFPLAIKGAIWYQGCSNVSGEKNYERLFPAMLADWRAGFSGGDFPVYAVQLASYMKTHGYPYDWPWARMRWTQAKMADSVKNYDFASAIDVGEHDDIHPKDKKTVGERLARLALAHDYGMNLEFSGPRAKVATIVDNEVVVYFTHADGLATCDGEAPSGFQLVDADGKAVWATAVLDGDKVLLAIPEGFVPTRIRHAWDDYPVRNLVNGAALPCGPFELAIE